MQQSRVIFCYNGEKKLKIIDETYTFPSLISNLVKTFNIDPHRNIKLIIKKFEAEIDDMKAFKEGDEVEIQIAGNSQNPILEEPPGKPE